MSVLSSAKKSLKMISHLYNKGHGVLESERMKANLCPVSSVSETGQLVICLCMHVCMYLFIFLWHFKAGSLTGNKSINQKPQGWRLVCLLECAVVCHAKCHRVVRRVRFTAPWAHPVFTSFIGDSELLERCHTLFGLDVRGPWALTQQWKLWNCSHLLIYLAPRIDCGGRVLSLCVFACLFSYIFISKLFWLCRKTRIWATLTRDKLWWLDDCFRASPKWHAEVSTYQKTFEERQSMNWAMGSQGLLMPMGREGLIPQKRSQNIEKSIALNRLPLNLYI